MSGPAHLRRAGVKRRRERIGKAELDLALLNWEKKQPGYVPNPNPWRFIRKSQP